MYGQADGHLRPDLLGRLGGVDLKKKEDSICACRTPVRMSNTSVTRLLILMQHQVWQKKCLRYINILLSYAMEL